MDCEFETYKGMFPSMMYGFLLYFHAILQMYLILDADFG